MYKRQEEYKEDKIKVVLCEPGKVARVAEISNTLAGLQKTVKGDIEQFCPYEEAVAIICNEEGKFNGMMPNRAIYSEPQEVEMSYGELTSRFREAERNGGEHLTGYIVFTEDSFTKPYPEAARTYAVSSNNKAFQPNMGGYSIYASALDGSDPMIRLEGYMQSEKGGKDGWKIERCYMTVSYTHLIAKIKRQINPRLRIDGILLTMVDNRTNNAKSIITSLRSSVGENIRVFELSLIHI